MDRQIIIAGGGIAGLACALALAKYGISSTIIEAASKPAEVGAGIQVPPNACHVMAQLQLLEPLIQKAVAPESIDLADATTGTRVLSLPVNTSDSQLFLTVHRASLHSVLYNAAVAEPQIELLEGYRIGETVDQNSSIMVTARSDNDSIELTTRLLIGADGVWSNTRQGLKGAIAAQLTGRIALRAIVPAAGGQNRVTAWMSPSAHLVSYPVRNGDTENLVAITAGDADNEKWAAQAKHETIAKLAASFANTPYGQQFTETKWTVWPLAQVPLESAWDNGTNCVLIGDAAHAIEPFAAQGAAMALEDALTLAKSVADYDTIQNAISAYTTLRISRVAKVAARTAFNRRIYHLKSPTRLARNAAFKLRPPSSFLQDLDWLYGHRA